MGLDIDAMIFTMLVGPSVAWWLLRARSANWPQPARGAPTAQAAAPQPRPDDAAPYRAPDSPVDFPSPRERLVMSLEFALRVASRAKDLTAEDTEKLAREVVNHIDEYLASGKEDPR